MTPLPGARIRLPRWTRQGTAPHGSLVASLAGILFTVRNGCLPCNRPNNSPLGVTSTAMAGASKAGRLAERTDGPSGVVLLSEVEYKSERKIIEIIY